MDVILLKNVDDLGNAGEIVSVARGFARNYLVPKGLAATVNEANLKLIKEEERLSGLRGKKLKREAEELSHKFNDVSCTISVQASEDDKLYGSVGSREIATAMAELGHVLEHHQIVLDEPIKQLGVYTVPVKLHEEVEVSVKVWVVKAES
jgi:large subunit ribosomal protein L9